MVINKIILGSQSPRRREFIQYLGFPVDSVSSDAEETFPLDLPLENVPEYLAKLKADSLNLNLEEGELLLTCDTVVILDNELLGKPRNEVDACKLLGKLSGRTHQVVSGVFMLSRNKAVSFSVTTWVTFAKLEEQQIKKYVDRCKPLDKAGAYGIQEDIGFVGVEKIEGSYMNVIGLPLAQIKEKLQVFTNE